ncbi:hypothetical protein [Myxosarcina sp. GI1]|uniref:hypothetical protein n=1 Tax=Myxosarcina sp. GI1 TaxID=1541065 RepID=UPI0012E09EA6|nr:hypothetical protein [Myxosarcina sp. GI1]
MSEEQSQKNSQVVRTSIGLGKEVVETLEHLAEIEKTNRTTIVNQILSVVCASSVSEGFETEKEKADLNTAQMLEKIIKLYLDLVNSPEVERLAKKTFRTHDLMIRQLVQKGIQLYED